ncbi:MAG: hypothetical protein WCV80_02875 [Candidatus Paceibacterota bacterium]|jgi:hypothetical protein
MKKTALFIFIVALCVVLIGIGFYIGDRKGTKQGVTVAEEKLLPIVEKIYPKPAEIIKRASVSITKILGATLTVEMNDPEDYIPHTDGTPKKKISRYVTVTGSTKIIQVNPAKRDAQGKPQTTVIKLSDLKVGDIVLVSTEENIRTTQLFDATQIELVK